MSLTLMATRSMPTVSFRPVAKATISLVPTPSVEDTSTGSSSPVKRALNSAPKPPTPPRTSLRALALTDGFIRSTSLAPSSMLTPASLYDSFFFMGDRLIQSFIKVNELLA